MKSKKSFIHFSNNLREKAIEIANLLNLNSLKTTPKHLSLPLIFSKAKAKHLNYLVVQVHKRVVSWKLKLLSRSTKLTLIQFVGSIMASYAASSVPLLASTCSQISGLLCNFWWKNNDNGRKHCYSNHGMLALRQLVVWV